MGFFDSIKKAVGGATNAANQAIQQQGRAAAPAAAAAPPPEPEAEAADDGDGEDAAERRNYDLEAVDDFSVADMRTKPGLEKWAVMRQRVEMAWDDKAERAKIFAEYGLRNPQHFYQVRETYQRFMATQADVGSLMQIEMNAQQQYTMKGITAQGAPGGAAASKMQAVDGVSLEQWAAMQASIAGGKDFDSVLATFKVDKAKWEKVNAEWNARLSSDTTFAVATAYGNAFTAASTGKYAAHAKEGTECMAQGKDPALSPPIPMEQYFEIMEAQSAASSRGQDVIACLQGFGLSAMDWSDVGSWYSAFINRNAMKQNAALVKQINDLQAKYKAKYGT